MIFRSAAAVTPSDSAQNRFDALLVVGTGGGTRLDVVPLNGSATVTLTVSDGQFLPLRVQQVMAATTASVVGLVY